MFLKLILVNPGFNSFNIKFMDHSVRVNQSDNFMIILHFLNTVYYGDCMIIFFRINKCFHISSPLRGAQCPSCDDLYQHISCYFFKLKPSFKSKLLSNFCNSIDKTPSCGLIFIGYKYHNLINIIIGKVCGGLDLLT